MVDPKTAEVRDLLKHLATYLATPPTLADGEAHPLTLTSDGKLRVDDPTTQAAIAAVDAKIDVAQADLDNPNQYKADVSALALEATLTAIKGAGWTTETLKAIKDAVDTRLAAASYVTERGTDNAMLAANGALEATLTAIKGAGWTTETLKVIKDAIAAITTERGTDGAALASSWTAALATALGNYTAARAAYLDNVNQAGLLQLTAARAALLDQITAARLAELDAANIPADLDVVKADTPYLADAALPVTPTVGSIGALVKTYLDAAVSSRLAAASYVTERGTNNAMLAANGALEATLTAIKGAGWSTQTLVALMTAIQAISGGATAQQVWEYATRVLTNLSDTRAAKIDNLDATISSRLAAASYAAERGTDNAALASVCTEARLARLDAAVTTRASATDYTAARAAKLDNVGKSSFITASEDLLLSNNTEVTHNTLTYTKKKENLMGAGGIYRIKFDLHSTSSFMAYGMIYVNGVAVGTQRTNYTGSYVTFSEDIAIKYGDLVQIYMKVDDVNYPGYVRNFRMYGVITCGVGGVFL